MEYSTHRMNPLLCLFRMDFSHSRFPELSPTDIHVLVLPHDLCDFPTAAGGTSQRTGLLQGMARLYECQASWTRARRPPARGPAAASAAALNSLPFSLAFIFYEAVNKSSNLGLETGRS